MTLWSGTVFGAPAKLLFASLAVAAIILSPIASAQTDVPAPAETAAALKCLLNHDRHGCGQTFAGSASRVATPWLWWTPDREFELGALLSSGYAGTRSGENVYISKFLNGRTTDLYDVKFKHHEKTFYIARPGPDGKVHYMLIRDGSPNDERTDLFVHGPG